MRPRCAARSLHAYVCLRIVLIRVPRSIVEDISFDAADKPPGTEVVIDVKDVQAKVGDLLSKTDLSRFIL